MSQPLYLYKTDVHKVVILLYEHRIGCDNESKNLRWTDGYLLGRDGDCQADGRRFMGCEFSRAGQSRERGHYGR